MIKSFISAFSVLFMALTSSGVSQVNAQINDELMLVVQRVQNSRLPANTDSAGNDLGEDPNMRMHRSLPSVTDAGLSDGQHVFISSNPTYPHLRGRNTNPEPTSVVPAKKAAPRITPDGASGTGR